MSYPHDSIESVCARMIETCKRRSENRAAYILDHPDVVRRRCLVHPESFQELDSDHFIVKDDGAIGHLPYLPCPDCSMWNTRVNKAVKLVMSGVPFILSEASFENFKPRNQEEHVILSKAQEFCVKKVGFLVMTGNFGSGKSHLAVACMPHFPFPAMVKQSTMLLKLRATYNDRTAENPIDEYKDVGLLVLDEVGLSSGGKDELPMLHEILDYRHSNMLPTIITSNEPVDQIGKTIGGRLVDRMCQSMSGVLVFTGQSNRPSLNASYGSKEAFYRDVEKRIREIKMIKNSL